MRQPAEAPGRIVGRRGLLAVFGLSVVSALAACGKRGRLRLPEPPTAEAESADEETR